MNLKRLVKVHVFFYFSLSSFCLFKGRRLEIHLHALVTCFRRRNKSLSCENNSKTNIDFTRAPYLLLLLNETCGCMGVYIYALCFYL